MKAPNEQPDDFDQLFMEAHEEMWTKDQEYWIANITLPVEVHDTLAAYAKEHGLEQTDLLTLAVQRGVLHEAISRWGKKVAALVDDPDLLDWPLDDPLLCLAIGMMRQLAIQSVKKWRERYGDADDQADWWKAGESG